MKNILMVLVTSLLWAGYAFFSIKAEEKYRWFSEWGALSFPLVVCGLLALNIWAGTSIAAGIFVAFVCIAMIWAFGKSLRY